MDRPIAASSFRQLFGLLKNLMTFSYRIVSQHLVSKNHPSETALLPFPFSSFIKYNLQRRISTAWHGIDEEW